MGKPIRFWANTFASLGFVRRKAKRSADSTLGRRHLTIEPLSPGRCCRAGAIIPPGWASFSAIRRLWRQRRGCRQLRHRHGAGRRA